MFLKHDKVQRCWAEQPVAAADLGVEQWEPVLISGLNNGRMTETRRAAGSALAADRRRSSAARRRCQKNISSSSFFPFQLLLCILAPLALITPNFDSKQPKVWGC